MFGLLVFLSMRSEQLRAIAECQTRFWGWNDAHKPLGKWLETWYEQRQARGQSPLTLAITDVGNVGWLSDVRIIDLAGLADPEWARIIYQSRNKAVYPTHKLLTRLKPEVIVLVSVTRPRGTDIDIQWFTDSQVYRDPEFQRRYVPVVDEQAQKDVIAYITSLAGK